MRRNLHGYCNYNFDKGLLITLVKQYEMCCVKAATIFSRYVLYELCLNLGTRIIWTRVQLMEN